MQKMENQHSSAVAFVEGGTQEACEDSCSICLEPFCNSDPSTVTICNHDFHLQCILEWCQHSSQCPMCWRPICLKDPTSKILLELVEKERIMRGSRPRRPVYVRPVLAGLEFGQLEASSESTELDEHLMQQLASVVINDRAFGIAEREMLSNSNRSTNSASSHAPALPQNSIATPSNRVTTGHVRQHVPPPHPSDSAPDQTFQSVSMGASGNNPGGSTNRNLSGKPTSSSNEITGLSDLQGFSESFKSRLNAASSRCRESIKKNTRGWRKRLFLRNVTLSDLGSEVKKEVSNGIASVSRMMQRLETKDNTNIARVAASDGSFTLPFSSNASSSNVCAASKSSK